MPSSRSSEGSAWAKTQPAFRPATRPVAAECTFFVCYLVKLCRPRFHDSMSGWHNPAHVMSTVSARCGHLNRS